MFHEDTECDDPKARNKNEYTHFRGSAFFDDEAITKGCGERKNIRFTIHVWWMLFAEYRVTHKALLWIVRFSVVQLCVLGLSKHLKQMDFYWLLVCNRNSQCTWFTKWTIMGDGLLANKRQTPIEIIKVFYGKYSHLELIWLDFEKMREEMAINHFDTSIAYTHSLAYKSIKAHSQPHPPQWQSKL